MIGNVFYRKINNSKNRSGRMKYKTCKNTYKEERQWRKDTSDNTDDTSTKRRLKTNKRGTIRMTWANTKNKRGK